MRGIQQLGLIGKIFIGFTLLAIGLITMVSWTGDSASNYGLSNPENLSSYDVAISLAEKQKDIKDSMDEEVTSEADNPLLQWRGAMNALKLLFSTSDDVQNFTASAIEDTHLPVQFNLLILVVVILILIAVMSALLKWVI